MNTAAEARQYRRQQRLYATHYAKAATNALQALLTPTNTIEPVTTRQTLTTAA